jgi:plastocyanin
VLRSRLVLAAALTIVAAVVLAEVAAAGHRSATSVAVTTKEFRFVLSTKSVPKGTVTFNVVNKGKIPHDFKIDGKKTALIPPGKKATLQVTFAKPGSYPYLCTVPGHAKLGMKGVLKVT